MSETATRTEPYILFQLGDTTYGLRSQFVQQMEMIEQVTPVPNAPPFVEGVVLSRGRVIPAINLRMRFGFEKIAYDLRTRLIIVQNGERTVGLIVDAAREFVTIPAETIQEPPDTVSGLSGRFLEGIASLGERLVLILDLDAVLALSEAIPQ